MDITITQKVVSTCYSLTEVAHKLGIFSNTRNRKKIRNKLIDQNIDFNHFTNNGKPPVEKIEKICPVCEESFCLKRYHKDQITCSYSCSNVYFARKRNKPENYKNYRTICFHVHEKKCVVCGEDKIVAVHHMDEDKNNDDPTNLIPLCPTHHCYWHSEYRHLIRDKILKYIKNFTGHSSNEGHLPD